MNSLAFHLAQLSTLGPPDLSSIHQSPVSAHRSFSLINLTSAVPTPEITGLVPSPVLTAPANHHHGPIVTM